MSEAPKKIWVANDVYREETEYVRADIVEEMREALVLCAGVLAGETLYKGALIRALEKSEAALKRLEEE